MEKNPPGPCNQQHGARENPIFHAPAHEPVGVGEIAGRDFRMRGVHGAPLPEDPCPKASLSRVPAV